MSKKRLTYEEVHRLFEYEPASGLLIRRVSVRGSRFKPGDSVGYCTGSGHLGVQVDGKGYLVHRVIWLLQTGKWPEAEVDHVNGVGSDNRWLNLREATHAENGRNLKKKSNNSSGYAGVCWNKDCQKWMARITLHGTGYHLGLYDTPEDAAQAYNGAAAIVFGEWQRKEQQ